MSACTVRTSVTASSAALVEAMCAPETSCAPSAQQSTQIRLSAVTACSDTRRWLDTTRFRRSIASVGSTNAATTSSAAPASARFALVRPIDSRSVSIPMWV